MTEDEPQYLVPESILYTIASHGGLGVKYHVQEVLKKGPVRSEKDLIYTFELRQTLLKIPVRKLALNDILGEEDGFTRIPDSPALKEGDVICIFRKRIPEFYPECKDKIS